MAWLESPTNDPQNVLVEADRNVVDPTVQVDLGAIKKLFELSHSLKMKIFFNVSLGRSSFLTTSLKNLFLLLGEEGVGSHFLYCTKEHLQSFKSS